MNGSTFAEELALRLRSASVGASTRSPMVLIGFAEALAAPEVAWSLADAGFRVIAFARRGHGSALRHSRYVICHEVTPPESDLQGSLADIRALLASISIPNGSAPRVLLPLDDKAVWISNAAKIDSGWVLAGASGGQARLALDKWLQAEAAREAGFNVPSTALAETEQDVKRFAAAERFPIMLRPAECVAVSDGRVRSCRKWTCADTPELDRALAEWRESVPLLVQPYIEGTGEGVFGLATPDGVRAWSAHRRLRMMNPHGSGSSACVSVPVPEELKWKAEALIRNTGWRGLFMIELLRDRSGTAWFVELNGRPWGSMALSRRQGLEYPAWHVSLALDARSEAGLAPPLTGAAVCRNAGREIMHLAFVLRGARSKAEKHWPRFWKAVADVLRIHHGESLYNWRRDDPKVFLADCYYTIHGNLFKGGH